MKKSNRKPRRDNLLSATARTGVDNKLTLAALMLEYAFEYNVNFKERTISISREIDEKEFDRLDNALTEMESQNRKAITIRINSPGGQVYQALAMIGRMKRSPCQIITEGYGHVMSAATLLLAAGDKRRISPYTFFMHHEASYGVDGRHSEIKDMVKQTEREEEKWCEWMASFTKKPKAFWMKSGVRTDAYFEAEELLEFGVVDEIME
jgi:ATP-dependent Clp protease protease subunit